MDQKRLELHEQLVDILGSRNVYFQPKENVTLSYPCIVYKRDYADTKFADNNVYLRKKRYQVTVIDRDPDSDIPEKVAQLPMCLFDRFYVADNLNHDIYNLYY